MARTAIGSHVGASFDLLFKYLYQLGNIEHSPGANALDDQTGPSLLVNSYNSGIASDGTFVETFVEHAKNVMGRSLLPELFVSMNIGNDLGDLDSPVSVAM